MRTRMPDNFKGFPEATIWSPTEVIEIGEGVFWYPGDNVVIPYMHHPAYEPCELKAHVYPDTINIRNFLSPLIEEMQQWLNCPQ